jgi:hypothetical protein
MFMDREEAEKIAKRTFKPASVERAWEHFAAKTRRLTHLRGPRTLGG